MFTRFHLDFLMNRQGYLLPKYFLHSFPSDAYAAGWKVIIDLLYMACIFKMLYSESKELIPALKNGIDGFFDYWAFWNAIDWASILTGLSLVAMWMNLTSIVSGGLALELAELPSQQQSNTVALDQRIWAAKKFLVRESMRIAVFVAILPTCSPTFLSAGTMWRISRRETPARVLLHT